jgi:hypothetical protein
VILFKACPRCEGDVDATFQNDVFCVQCGHRLPETSLMPRSQAIQQGQYKGVHASAHQQEEDSEGCGIFCPRCDFDNLVRLEKLRTLDNTCYRCRRCGHIFSPRVQGLPERSGAVLS